MAQAQANPNTGTTSHPLHRADMTIHELDGEALVFDAASGDTHRLNETALFIWRQCEGRLDAREVAERLAEVYDLPTEAALGHVTRMFREFRERDLVVPPD